ncbi:SGNH/GDSL hydrolase family protein [Bifidobacterium oedipodis]|nr:SGNH/GDSL hydrolase family protein [Bifidobacterium sp. DSM 109957]
MKRLKTCLIAMLMAVVLVAASVCVYHLPTIRSWFSTKEEPQPAAQQQKPKASSERTLTGTELVVIGDSYHDSDTTDYQEAGEQLADLSGLRLHNYATLGTGWLKTTIKDGESVDFTTQIDSAIEEAQNGNYTDETALVVVAGGYNDAFERYDSAETEQLLSAVRRGLTKLKKAFPSSVVLFVPYLAANDPTLPQLMDREVAAQVIDTAEKTGVDVAPYAWEWNLGQDQYFNTSEDAIHPDSDAGFRHIAQMEWDAALGKHISHPEVTHRKRSAANGSTVEYLEAVSLKKGVISGSITFTPIISASASALDGIMTNSALWNVWDGTSVSILDEDGNDTGYSIELNVQRDSEASPFTVTGSGVLLSGESYTATFPDTTISIP